MKKIFLIGLVVLAMALVSGCVESIRNIETISYGDKENKIEIGKIVSYKLILHKHNLFGSFISDEVLLTPNEAQKKFAEYFIQGLKKEFKQRGIILVEGDNETFRIIIACRPPSWNTGAGGIIWTIKNTDKKIKRMVIIGNWPKYDNIIKGNAERLAHESFQDFLMFL